MRLLIGLLFFSLVAPAWAQKPEDKTFFAGGGSDIESSDSSRARKAIRKWSSADGEQDGKPLSGAPFFWDHTRVGDPVFLRIVKNSNRKGVLEVWLEKAGAKQYELYKTYRIQYYSGRLGPKTRTGDFQAPEGFYYVSRGRMNPQSSYHLSMDMGYPNAFDQSKKRTGSYLMIHGKSVSIGCYAMSDCSIEQIYTLVDGALKKSQKIVRVHAFPFPMTDENLESHRESKHYEFWQNLKEGWDWFEEKKRPPNVTVSGGKYVFSD